MYQSKPVLLCPQALCQEVQKAGKDRDLKCNLNLPSAGNGRQWLYGRKSLLISVLTPSSSAESISAVSISAARLDENISFCRSLCKQRYCNQPHLNTREISWQLFISSSTKKIFQSLHSGITSVKLITKAILLICKFSAEWSLQFKYLQTIFFFQLCRDVCLDSPW